MQSSYPKIFFILSLVLVQSCKSKEREFYKLSCHGVVVALPSNIVIKDKKNHLDDLKLDSSDCSVRFKMKDVKLTHQYEKQIGGIIEIFKNPQTVIDNKKIKNELVKAEKLSATSMRYINDDFKIYVDNEEFGFGYLLYAKEKNKLSYIGRCSKLNKDLLDCSMTLLIGKVLVDYSLINKSITKENIEVINEYLLNTIRISGTDTPISYDKRENHTP